LRNNSSSFTIRRASSFVSSLAADRRPGLDTDDYDEIQNDDSFQRGQAARKQHRRRAGLRFSFATI
jgi:hypothetical protein